MYATGTSSDCFFTAILRLCDSNSGKLYNNVPERFGYASWCMSQQDSFGKPKLQLKHIKINT